MDQLTNMRIFTSVATLGSFAQAARQLRLSPSAVTRAVAQLEEQLDLTLLTRTTRSLRVTPRGAIYLESCRRILQDIEDAGRRARSEDAAPHGDMSIAAPILFGRLHVLPIVTHLLEAHPALRIRLVLSDRNVHLVEDGIDAAIRIGELADSSLIAVKLGEVSQMLAVSPAYLARRDAPAAPAELAGHDLIAFEGITTTSEWRFGGGASVRIEPRFAVNSAEAAIAAAEAGLGITRALSYQVDAALRAGRLVRVLPGFEPPPVPVSALHPASRLVSANIAAFIAAARAYFRATPILPPPCA